MFSWSIFANIKISEYTVFNEFESIGIPSELYSEVIVFFKDGLKNYFIA